MVRFYLMGEKGFKVLSSVLEQGMASIISDVVVAKDLEVEEDFSQQITHLCQTHSVRLYERRNETPHTNWAIAVSWRWLISPTDKLIVFHDSLLPRYRGFAPLVTALKNGDTIIGVSAIMASDQYDTGDLISQARLNIKYPIRIAEAITEVSQLYCDLALPILRELTLGLTPTATKQDSSQASYSLWLDSEDYFINWNLSSQAIERHVHATGFPYLGAKTRSEGKTYTILDGQTVPDVKVENRHIGKIIFIEHGSPVIVCGEGLFKITKMTNEAGESALPFTRFRSRFR